jgi:glucose-6-phosphate dehydrogenase assembly protein OpcA
MSSIFEALPGVETPVGAISKNLARLWAKDEGTPASVEAADSKATQVNFVLHLGLHTTAEDALAQFQTAARFSKRYPCRVVVLCPTRDDSNAPAEIRAKIYGECHPGKTRGDLRCCEFVLLSYPTAARVFLENQVSICLSTDLPLYYWAHNFSSSAKLGAYQYLLRRATRVLIDRSLVPAEDCGAVSWPRPEAVRDLVSARLLPVRQTLGQFLGAFPPAAIADGLTELVVSHGSARRAEGTALAEWARVRLLSCGAPANLPVHVQADAAAAPHAVEIQFLYANVQTFRFLGDLERGTAQISAHYRGARTELATPIALLSPEAALGEAMFF